MAKDRPADGSVRVLMSLVAPDALAPLVEHAYDIGRGGPVICRLLSSNDNDHYLVTAGEAIYALRVYPHAKHWLENESDYRFEMDWLDFLHERGLPVAHPIRRTDGDFLGALEAPEGRRYWALFGFAPGANALDAEQSVGFGESVARIHVASNDFHSPHHRAHFDLDRIADKPVRQIRAWFANLPGNPRQEDVAFVAALSDELKEQILAAGFTDRSEQSDEWGVIGGDFHGGNHHFSEDGRLTHFDFDLCGYGWRAYDLAIFSWAVKSRDDALWRGFLQGYESVRALSARERRYIPVFGQLRHIWWMGSHTTYPSAPSWLNNRNWDFKFTRLREMNQKWREEPQTE